MQTGSFLKMRIMGVANSRREMKISLGLAERTSGNTSYTLACVSWGSVGLYEWRRGKKNSGVMRSKPKITGDGNTHQLGGRGE